MGNGIYQLKEIWDRFCAFFDVDLHGPFFPEPAIRQALEERGYVFEFDVIAQNQGIKVPPHNILSPDGKPLFGLDADEDALERYLALYHTEARVAQPRPQMRMEM